jgi:glycosyltransferase involved in cell wall biosynthesis
MKIVHWSFKNGSGLHRVAEDLALFESEQGHTSILVDSTNEVEWGQAEDADINVVHAHLPDKMRVKAKKIVWFAHGTPEHIFTMAVEDGLHTPHGASDPLMIAQYWLHNADAVVTFWERHQWILQKMAGKHLKIDCLPMGIDTEFWQPVPSRGKFTGEPSLMTAENCHYIKWPLDLLILFPELYQRFPEICLHLFYVPLDQHRWFLPLINANGTALKTFVVKGALGKEDLRNAFTSVDYYINPVKYGDHNRMTMEAKASGCKVISYAGNQYSDFWLPEGDQRVTTGMLADILAGNVEPRTPEPVVDVREVARQAIEIYERVA